MLISALSTLYWAVIHNSPIEIDYAALDIAPPPASGQLPEDPHLANATKNTGLLANQTINDGRDAQIRRDFLRRDLSIALP